jgi:hypothetical protein
MPILYPWSPAELRAKVVYWDNSDVFYRVFTKLSMDEALGVGQALDSCRQ